MAPRTSITCWCSAAPDRSDKIQLTDNYSGLHDFAAVSAHTVQVGADCAIDLGNGNLIVLLGVQMSTLTAGDFLFA